MGIYYSKKENNGNYIRINSPFVCDFELKENYNYNRENYLKFFPKKKIDIMKGDNCNITIFINGIYITDTISLDVSRYKQKVDVKEVFYELEIRQRSLLQSV